MKKVPGAGPWPEIGRPRIIELKVLFSSESVEEGVK